MSKWTGCPVIACKNDLCHAECQHLRLKREQTRKGLEAAIRAANLAVFVIRKQGVMPNSSWESGFNSDLKTAEDAMAALNQQLGESR